MGERVGVRERRYGVVQLEKVTPMGKRTTV